MNKLITTSAITALAVLGLTACGGSEKESAEVSEVTKVVTVTRVIDGNVGSIAPTASKSAPDPVAPVTSESAPEPAAPVTSESAPEQATPEQAAADQSGSVVLPGLSFPELSLPPVSMPDFSRLADLNFPSSADVSVGCSGTKALVTVEVSGGSGALSVTASRMSLVGTISTVDLAAGTTPGLFEGMVAGWFDSVTVVVTDGLGRTATQTITFDLVGC
ncbi:MAG: hypothetical protein ACKOHN_00185 [Actinomycetota bacterium]